MKEIVSPEEWRVRLDRAVNAKRGRWRVLPREIASSRAFAELSRSGLIVVLAMLDNLTYQQKSKRKNARCLECGGLPLDNKGEFVLTNNELIARGLKSPESIARGRREAWELGFYDVLKTGTLMNYGVYRYSERWKNFPNGDYLPHDQPKPGKCLYPTKKKKLKPTTDSVVSTTTENVVREVDDVTTENVVIEEDSPTTDSVVNIIMYQENNAGVQVLERDPGEGPDKQSHQDTICSTISGDDQDLNCDYPTLKSITDLTPVQPNDSEPTSIKHQWFIEAFSTACVERGVEADLKLNQSLASSLDDWMDKRLGKRSYLGNKCFYDEKPNNIQEKINQIVSQWEFIEISYLGKRIQVPPVPDLTFLVTYREAIFIWVSEQRQQSLDAIFAQFEMNDQETHAGYAH